MFVKASITITDVTFINTRMSDLKKGIITILFCSNMYDNTIVKVEVIAFISDILILMLVRVPAD